MNKLSILDYQEVWLDNFLFWAETADIGGKGQPERCDTKPAQNFWERSLFTKYQCYHFLLLSSCRKWNSRYDWQIRLPRLRGRWWYCIGLAMKFKQKPAKYVAFLKKLFLFYLLLLVFTVTSVRVHTGCKEQQSGMMGSSGALLMCHHTSPCLSNPHFFSCEGERVTTWFSYWSRVSVT